MAIIGRIAKLDCKVAQNKLINILCHIMRRLFLILEKEDAFMSNTLNKSLGMLDIFLKSEKPLSAMDVAGLMKMSRSNVHKYLAVLKDYQYLHYSPEEKKYSLGLKFFEFAKALQQRLKIDDLARTFMEELYRQVGELVVLSILDHDRAYSVATVGNEQSGYMYAMQQGHSMPLYTGAISTVLLAFQDDVFIENFLKNNELVKVTPNTITAESILLRRIKSIREQGYFVTDHEVNPGGRAIAAPIFNCYGKIQASLGVVGPLFSLSDERLDTVTAQVQAVAAKISARLANDNIHDMAGGY